MISIKFLLEHKFFKFGGIILVDIVKKSGSKEPFDRAKIKRSIEKATIDANYSLEEIKTLTEEIVADITEKYKKVEELNTNAIRTIIFKKLNDNESSIVESWKKFDARYKPKT